MFLCQEPPKKEEAIVIQELEAKSPFLLLLLLLLVFEVTLPLLLLLLFSTLRCKQSQAPASASAIHSLRNGNVICWPFSSPPTFLETKKGGGKAEPLFRPPFFVSSGNSRGDRLFRGRERGGEKEELEAFYFFDPFWDFLSNKRERKG